MKKTLLPLLLLFSIAGYSQSNESITAVTTNILSGKAVVKVTNKLDCTNPVETEGRFKILPVNGSDTFHVAIPVNRPNIIFTGRKGCFEEGRTKELEVSIKVLPSTITNIRYQIERY